MCYCYIKSFWKLKPTQIVTGIFAMVAEDDVKNINEVIVLIDEDIFIYGNHQRIATG